MAQRKPEDLTYDQVLELVDALVPEERAQLYRHLQFRFWDEESELVRQNLNMQRAAEGLPAATDEDVHSAIHSMRTADDWAELRNEIQKGLDQLDRGEGIPVESALADLRERNKNYRNQSKGT